MVSSRGKPLDCFSTHAERFLTLHFIPLQAFSIPAAYFYTFLFQALFVCNCTKSAVNSVEYSCEPFFTGGTYEYDESCHGQHNRKTA